MSRYCDSNNSSFNNNNNNNNNQLAGGNSEWQDIAIILLLKIRWISVSAAFWTLESFSIHFRGASAREAHRGAPWMRKSGNPSMWEILVVTLAYARIYVRPSVQTLGEWQGSPKATRHGWRMPSFLSRKSRGAFGQPEFFLAGNRMSTVPFGKKRVFLEKA